MHKSGYAAPPAPRRGEFQKVTVAIVATRWNVEVVDNLIHGARAALRDWGVPERSVEIFRVPGAFELPLGVSYAAATGQFDAVVALGVVIRGDTPHFDYVCAEASRGLMSVQLETHVPVGNGVLTVNTPEQADERAVPGPENKGWQAAQAALEMLRLSDELTVDEEEEEAPPPGRGQSQGPGPYGQGGGRGRG